MNVEILLRNKKMIGPLRAGRLFPTKVLQRIQPTDVQYVTIAVGTLREEDGWRRRREQRECYCVTFKYVRAQSII